MSANKASPVSASTFTTGARAHALASWRAVGRTYGLIHKYHEYRTNRPTAEKIKLGCLAFVVLWVPFVIPFLVYSYTLLAAGVVFTYACLVSLVWGVSAGIDWLRGRRAGRR